MGLKLHGRIIIPVQKAIWESVNPMLLYISETTVPPSTRLGSPMANQVLGIHVAGCFLIFVMFSKTIFSW